MTDSTDEEPFEISYSRLMKIGLVIAPAVIAGIACVLLGAARSLLSSPLLAIAMAALGVWFFYITYLALRSLPYVNVIIRVRDWGLEFVQGERVRRLTWDEIGAVRRDDIHQVLTIRDLSGATVVMVDYVIRGYAELDEVLREYARR